MHRGKRAFWLLLASMVLVQGCGPGNPNFTFMAAWSPDGSLAAVVSNLLDDNEMQSGIWIADLGSGSLRQIFQAEDGYYCLHPQWSVFSNELLFAQVRRDKSDEDADRIAVSIWVIDENGGDARKVAETELAEESVLWTNRIAWGLLPNTIIIEELTGPDSSTAIVLDLISGSTTRFLPADASGWVWEKAPDGRRAAALLFDTESGVADVFVGGIRGDWRKLRTINLSGLSGRTPGIFWSPDSRWFVVSANGTLLLFDAVTGTSRHIHEAGPKGRICWAPDSSQFAFAGDWGALEGIFSVNLDGTKSSDFPGDGLDLLAWHGGKQRIISYFCHAKEHSRGLGGFTAKLLEGDVGSSVSPDGRHALFFGEDVPVVAADLPFGNRIFTLPLTAHQLGWE
jgi:hypothetical protein